MKKTDRNKRSKIGRTVMAAILSLVIIMVLTLGWLFKNNKITETFAESNKELSNPERGYYWQVDSSKKDKFAKLEEEGYRLTLLTLDLQSHSQEVINQEKLSELEEALKEAKRHHMAVIFRAAYGFDKIPSEPEKLETIGSHISQIAPILNKHSDNILCIQAGMLGAYGEWHSGKFLTQDDAEAKKARIYVLQQWEEHLAKEMQVSVRRPRFIREAEGVLENRLGIHNDALLSTDDDMGTYDDYAYGRKEELEWMEKELFLRKNGGEMPLLSENSKPSNADFEFGKMHVSYLNRSYLEDIFEEWKTLELKGENAEQYINNHLGYRLFLSQADRWKEISSFPFSLLSPEFTLHITNSGYAPIDADYKMYVVVETDQERHMQEQRGEELYAISNGEAALCKINLNIAAKDILGDTVKIGIKIAKEPEAEEKDSIQLANEEIQWQDGINWMFQYEIQRQ